jgi:hypothetical protein
MKPLWSRLILRWPWLWQRSLLRLRLWWWSPWLSRLLPLLVMLPAVSVWRRMWCYNLMPPIVSLSWLCLGEGLQLARLPLESSFRLTSSSFLFLVFQLVLLSFLISFLFLREKSFSRDHSSFFLARVRLRRSCPLNWASWRRSCLVRRWSWILSAKGVRTLRGLSVHKSLRWSREGMKPWPPCGSPLGNLNVSRSVKVSQVFMLCFLLSLISIILFWFYTISSYCFDQRSVEISKNSWGLLGKWRYLFVIITTGLRR